MATNLGTSVTTKKLKMQPVPLLVILASFKPHDAKSFEDGMQMASTDRHYWHDIYFGDEGYTLKNFYKEMSGGKFYFSPADVKGSDAPGVIEVTLDLPHPEYIQNNNPTMRTGAALYVVAKAIEAAGDYVDFASYDKDGDGYLSSDEFNVVVIHAGFDYSGGKEKTDTLHWGVFANCGILSDGEDTEGFPGAHAPTVGGVKVCAAGHACYTLIGEYRKTENGFVPHPFGTAAHELGHAIGFHDIYDYDREVSRWPLPTMFSLMCHGNYGRLWNDPSQVRGSCPTHLDPFQKIRAGLIDTVEVNEDGEYSVFSVSCSTPNILRINTPDKKEYFLLENRQTNGFNAGLYTRKTVCDAEGNKMTVNVNYERGGIIIWHIDEDVFDKFSGIKRTNGSGFWNPDGETKGTERHDPGIVAVFKNGFDENGLMKDDGVYTCGYPEDPFFRAGDVFNSNEYISAATHTRSLNSFPEGLSEDTYNLRIEFLEDDGREIKIRVKQKK